MFGLDWVLSEKVLILLQSKRAKWWSVIRNIPRAQTKYYNLHICVSGDRAKFSWVVHHAFSVYCKLAIIHFICDLWTMENFLKKHNWSKFITAFKGKTISKKFMWTLCRIIACAQWYNFEVIFLTKLKIFYTARLWYRWWHFFTVDW